MSSEPVSVSIARGLRVKTTSPTPVKPPVAPAKKPVPPKFLGGESPDTKGKDRRAVLADAA